MFFLKTKLEGFQICQGDLDSGIAPFFLYGLTGIQVYPLQVFRGSYTLGNSVVQSSAGTPRNLLPELQGHVKTNWRVSAN